MIPFHTYLTFLVILSVTYFSLTHIHITVIPGQLVIIIDVVIQFGMHSCTCLLRRIIPILNAIVRCTRLIINLAFLSTISIQETSCQHDSQLVVKEAVTVRDTGCQVRQRLFPVHPQVGHAEVIHGHLIIFRFSHCFIRRLFGNISVIERLEITVEIHRIVSGRKIGGKLPFGRSILHDQIHRSTDTVALHIGRQ